jgi:hypothetical protein
MAKCDVCGNDYDKSFEVASRVFRTFFRLAISVLGLGGHCGGLVAGIHGEVALG